MPKALNMVRMGFADRLGSGGLRSRGWLASAEERGRESQKRDEARGLLPENVIGGFNKRSSFKVKTRELPLLY